MIIYKPVPLLEASLFLSNRETGNSIKEYFANNMELMISAGGRAVECANALIELETRLESSIDADDATIALLFKPFERDIESSVQATHFAANLIAQDISNYYDYNSCFNNLHNEKHRIRNVIANWISGSADYSGVPPLDADEFFNIVKNSGLVAETKWLCLDIAANYDEYVDMLEHVLRPVAEEFCRCEKLIKPLLDLFSADYSEEESAANILAELCQNMKTSLDEIRIYPLVTYYKEMVVNFVTDNGHRIAEGGIGVLYKFIRENYTPKLCDREVLAKIMNALSGKNRFNIVALLADGPVYGRELARMLDVAPATISQHMVTLMGANLVKIENDGYRVHYSLNREGVRVFIDMLKRLLLKE